MIKLPILFCLTRKGPSSFAACRNSPASFRTVLRAIVVFFVCILFGSALTAAVSASFAKAAYVLPSSDSLDIEYVDTLFECQPCHKGFFRMGGNLGKDYAKKLAEARNANFSNVVFTASTESDSQNVGEIDRWDFNNTLELSRGSSSSLVREFFSQQKNRNSIPKVEITFHVTGEYFYKIISRCELCLQSFTPVPLLVDKRAVVAERPGSPRASPLSV